jgi:hypothetical protein
MVAFSAPSSPRWSPISFRRPRAFEIFKSCSALPSTFYQARFGHRIHLIITCGREIGLITARGPSIMHIILDWLGVSTLSADDRRFRIFLDVYMDRVPATPPVGITSGDVERADYILIGHSHFDHLWGAERIATRTGATVVGSYETFQIPTQLRFRSREPTHRSCRG